MHFNMDSPRSDAIGFIGLGAMGLPMAQQLVENVPAPTRLYVFDIADQAMNDFVAMYPHKAVAGKSPRDVAEHSVSILVPTR